MRTPCDGIVESLLSECTGRPLQAEINDQADGKLQEIGGLRVSEKVNVVPASADISSCDAAGEVSQKPGSTTAIHPGAHNCLWHRERNEHTMSATQGLLAAGQHFSRL